MGSDNDIKIKNRNFFGNKENITYIYNLSVKMVWSSLSKCYNFVMFTNEFYAEQKRKRWNVVSALQFPDYFSNIVNFNTRFHHDFMNLNPR